MVQGSCRRTLLDLVQVAIRARLLNPVLSDSKETIYIKKKNAVVLILLKAYLLSSKCGLFSFFFFFKKNNLLDVAM